MYFVCIRLQGMEEDVLYLVEVSKESSEVERRQPDDGLLLLGAHSHGNINYLRMFF